MVEDQKVRPGPRRPRDIKGGEGAAVRLVQLGKQIQSFRVPEGGTLEQALSMGDIPAKGGMDIRVNGKKVTPSYALHEGDLITVVPFIRGGGAMPTSRSIPRRPRSKPQPSSRTSTAPCACALTSTS